LREHDTRHYDGSASRRASKPACTKWRSLVRALGSCLSAITMKERQSVKLQSLSGLLSNNRTTRSASKSIPGDHLDPGILADSAEAAGSDSAGAMVRERIHPFPQDRCGRDDPSFSSFDL
jgi:hypothetical protein